MYISDENFFYEKIFKIKIVETKKKSIYCNALNIQINKEFAIE